jgi:cardiolipin synthase
VPLFAWLLLVQHERTIAAFLLAGVGITDWVDGYVARRFDQVSALGKVLDPVADRVVLIVGVVAILVDGSAPLWLGIMTLVREALVSVGTLSVAALGGRRIDVQWFGKAGTFGLYLAYPMFLASHAQLGNPDVWRTMAWVCAITGLVLGWIALGTYVPMARRALQEKTT